MPSQQSVFGQSLCIILCCIEHHLDNALNVPVGRGQGADIDAQAPGE